ncbi:MAG TPA: PH domain-containing protein [Pyrinomonadaceae bacterium]|jgi:membrane protein YdbS with pleckstrin-like domain
MHCTNCGSYIAPGTRFCAGCGAPAIDPEMTRLAGARAVGAGGGGSSDLKRNDESSEIERTIFTARPTMLFIKIGYAAAALGAILLTILLALLPFLTIPWYVSLPLALALLLIPAYYHVRRNMVSYTLTDSKVMIDQGLVARTTRNIPLRNIQDVTVSSSILQRLLGFGNLIIDNASEQGGTTILRNIDNPRHHADLLLRELRRWR